ncbi:MAG: hypothetical protein AMK73_09295 [Planctomycetes bacterium SM23_32]|nr:MAG: hypothetical protein AMK73_09295 [Planctomycetes bacterium SM23_32]
MGISDLMSAAEKAYQVAQKLRDAELNEVIADLRLKAAELKADMAELRAENAELRESIEEMRRQADIRAKVAFDGHVYWAEDAIEGYGKGPFCPTCLDGDARLVNLVGPGKSVPVSGSGVFRLPNGTLWMCHRCAKSRGA